MKLENKMNSLFKSTKKDILMTEEEEEQRRTNYNCWFCETEIDFNKVRCHCHLTGTSRGPAHEKFNVSFKEKNSKFIP